MKKRITIMVVILLIIGLTLNARTDEKTVVRNVNGLAPRKLIGTPNYDQMANPNVSRDPDYQVYAYNASITPPGPVTFVLNDPAGLTQLATTTSEDFMAGACWKADEETWYACEFGGGLYTIDHETGAMTYVGPTGAELAGIEYDDDSGIMYGSDGYNLYTVDWTTGMTTLVGSHNIPTDRMMIGIAGDGEGSIYGVTVSWGIPTDLYLFDLANGNAESLGSTGIVLTYAQDIAFDKDDGVLYSAAYFGDGITPPGLYTIDTSTFAFAQIGDFPFSMEVTGFAIPYTPAEPGAPAAPTDFAVIPDAGGALEATISWTCPTLQVNGDPLTDLDEMRVYRGEDLIYTDTTPVIGGPGVHVDSEVLTSGIYTYKAVGYNDFGEGYSASGTIWVGEDVPNVVESLLLEQTAPGTLSGTLTWTNPTTGLNGGAFNNSILGYHIVRYPDNTVIEVVGITTSYVDEPIPTAGFYYYDVQPYNSIGDGGIATSNVAAIVDADILFYEDFSGSVPPAGWYIDGLGQTSWTSSATNYAGGVAPEAMITWIEPFVGMSRMCTNTLDTSGMTAMAVEFKHTVSDFGGGYTLGVATSSDGTNWTDVWTIFPAGGIIGPETISVDITTADVGSATFQMCFYLDGDSYQINLWAIDDVLLTTDGVGNIEEDLPVLYTKLGDNYPNPFNPETTISFSVAQTSSFVNLEVFNIKGQKVRKLVDEVLSAGQHSVVWNGKDENSKPVSSGVYFYKMRTGAYTRTKKMILLK